MARPEERMRLKDKIIDNISKAIKSIQSHHFYKALGPDNGRIDSGFTLGNVDKPCHKLCENLDHAFLHGLKNVSHGYWPVVKQLSHKGMIKEIEMLINVTTDLGRGRAWLYASLNEGLLESYLRMLDENEKLVKKYYAKEALLLDHDRLSLLLTLITGLECVTFQLDFDQPYLDLNAYPPRGRSDSEVEDSVGPGSSSIERDKGVSGGSVPSPAVGHPPQGPDDSDSSSMASVDVQSNHTGADHPNFGLTHQQQSIMQTSSVSSDSGFPVGGRASGEMAQSPTSVSSFSLFNDGERRSITPTSISSQKQRGSKNMDAISVSSIGSSGDPDRMRRVEHILPQRDGGDDEADGGSLEVIRIKSKRGSGQAKSKKKKKERHSDGEITLKRDRSETVTSQMSLTSETDPRESETAQRSSGCETSDIKEDNHPNGVSRKSSDVAGEDDKKLPSKSSENLPKKEHLESQGEKVDTGVLIPQFDSGVDIHCLLGPGAIQSDTLQNMPSETLVAKSWDRSKSAFAQIENKIAELCFVSEENQPSKKHLNTNNTYGLSDSNDITNQDSLSASRTSGLSHDHKSSNSHHYVNQMSSTPPSSSSQAASGTVHNTSRGLAASVPRTQTSQNSGSDSTTISTLSQNSHDLATSITNDLYTDGHSSNAKTDNSVYDQETEDDFDFYACDDSEADQGKTAGVTTGMKMTAATAQITNAHAASQLEDYMDFILQGAESPPEALSPGAVEEVDKSVDLAVDLDNNTKLQVMLDIFTQEHEKFIKMFATRENHTEGEPTPVYVVISDHCLYILHYKRMSRKFTLSSSANLVDLIFVSTGLNDQTLNIESREKNRQKQRLWLTPGHQNLTQAILSCLTDAVKAANEHVLSVRSRFSVGSEVPLQKIALRKYISKEMNTEAQDVSVSDYSLVFWEDPSSDTDSLKNAAGKEGTLLLRSHDPIKGHVWKPVYVVLKDSMLCVSNHKTDVRPHSYLGLGGDQCVGCRLVSTADRPNCVELVLSSGVGGSWFLSAASEQEISEWRHSLCLAVSQGMQDPNSLSSCVPCCTVLSSNQLFMCHEDLHTKFFRTLGRAQLEDVTGISVDPQDPTYCVIEFESQELGVSSVQWVLYFAASLDRDRHTAAVSSEWKEIYKIDLPVGPLENLGLQRHCRSYADLLRKQLSFI